MNQSPDNDPKIPHGVGVVLLSFVCFGALFIWMPFSWDCTESSFLPALGIGSCSIAALAWLATRLAFPTRIASVCASLILVAFIALGIAFGGYYRHWTNDSDDWYTDSFRFISGAHVYRSFSEKGFGYRAEGPMAGTGKMHGKWAVTITDWQAADPADLVNQHYEFYWYGERITEGEFYLRSGSH